MTLPGELGTAKRPLAEFPHDKHTAELKAEDCKACHVVDEKLGVMPVLIKQPARFVSADEFVKFYHGTCLGCHEKRRAEGKKTGPLTCGECHLSRPPAASERKPMRYDYSLHFRHVKATAEPAPPPENRKDRCDACHHAYDEKKKTRAYLKGAEAACRDCHGAQDKITPERKQRSLRNASHIACINCHRETLKKIGDPKKSGPADCAGCHDAKRQSAIAVLKPEQIERLKVDRQTDRQPDRAWVETPKTAAPLVAFDHKLHEPRATMCRDCHHDTLKRCSECHTVPGDIKGGRVTLEQAQHDARSGHACVGCHAKQTGSRNECAGCHSLLLTPPEARACTICHAGPVPAVAPGPAASTAAAAVPGQPAADASPVQPAAGVGSAQPAVAALPPLPPELLAEVKADPLPKVDPREFPEKVTIDVGGKKYKPTEMPHLKIVKKLYDEAVKSKLANRFHGRTATLCAGCHHHSPIGQRPPPCGSCHGTAATGDKDKPPINNAFHRQCIGCHQQMAHKSQGCVDCHKLENAAAEVAR